MTLLSQGAKRPLPKEAEPVDYYFFSQLSATNEDCLIDVIVRETNRYARQQLDSIEELKRHSRVNKWRKVTRKMSPFLRRWFSMGLV